MRGRGRTALSIHTALWAPYKTITSYSFFRTQASAILPFSLVLCHSSGPDLVRAQRLQSWPWPLPCEAEPRGRSSVGPDVLGVFPCGHPEDSVKLFNRSAEKEHTRP